MFSLYLCLKEMSVSGWNMTEEGWDLIVRYICGILVILRRIFLCSYSPLPQRSVYPKEGCAGGERSRGEAVWGAAESTWSVQPGEAETEGRPHHGLQLPPEGKQRGRLCDRTQGNGLELCQRRFRMDFRKMFLTQSVVEHTPQSGGHSTNLTEFKLVCVQVHGVILGAVLCRARSWTWLSLQVPSNLAYSVILYKHPLKTHHTKANN